MKEFNVTLDTKYTMWHRYIVKIEAETLEDAQAKLMDYRDNNEYIDSINSEWLYDTAEKISLKENVAMSECNQLLPDNNWEKMYDADYAQVEEFPDELNYEIEK